MKYVANPVVVDAFKIKEVLGPHGSGGYRLLLDEHQGEVIADSGMCARMTPKVGDCWVVQEDGYVYLNPKEVFERKYHPAGE